MDKSEIVEMMSSRMRKAVKQTIDDAIKEVNAQGHAFTPVSETLKEWGEPGQEETLNICWDLDVSFTIDRPIDSITKDFISMVKKGDDPEAEMLGLFRYEMVYSGFRFLYEKKGAPFLRDVIVLLEKIKSKSTLRLVEEAFQLLENNKTVPKKFEAMKMEIYKLNDRHRSLKEDPYKLFVDYRRSPRGTTPLDRP
jgi:hypothetical protein